MLFGFVRTCPLPHTLLRKEMLQNPHKWAITTHEVDRILFVLARMSEAETDQGLTGPWNTGQEADGMLFLLTRLIHVALDRFADGLNLMLRSLGVCNLSN